MEDMNNEKDDSNSVKDLGHPLSWMQDYVKEIILDGGFSILPYICSNEKKEDFE